MHFTVTILGDQSRAQEYFGGDDAREHEADYFAPLRGVFWMKPGHRSTDAEDRAKVTDEVFVEIMSNLTTQRAEIEALADERERAKQLRELAHCARLVGDQALCTVGDVDWATHTSLNRLAAWREYETTRALLSRHQDLLANDPLWLARMCQTEVGSMVATSWEEPLPLHRIEYLVKAQYWYTWAFIDARGEGPPRFATAHDFHHWMGNAQVHAACTTHWDLWQYLRLIGAPSDTPLGVYHCHA